MKNKTTETTNDVFDFINSFANTPQKKEDSYRLLALMEDISGYPPKLWGPSIIGFGKYHYQYASGHEGDAPLIAFSPRKAAISLYVYTGDEVHKHLLNDLGKFEMGKSCIYIKKLDDISLDKLQEMMKETIRYLKLNYLT
jgi:hypothetical protein